MLQAVNAKPFSDPAFLYLRIRDAAYKPDPEPQAWLAAIDRKSWEALTWLVNQRYTSVDLYHHLRLTDSIQFVPKAERDFLEGCAELAAEQEQRYISDIERIVAALRDHEISATLLKGAALISGGYYPWVGHRFISDIDIAVCPSALDDALNALEQRGFKMEISLPRPVKAYWRSKNSLPALWHKDCFFRLECHSRPMDATLTRTPPFDTQALLNKGSSIELGEGAANIPCAEHLVVHAFYHSQLNDRYELAGVDNYRALIDVATVIAHAGKRFDWLWVNGLTRSISAEKSFALFVDRIATCVDSRAWDWPVDRSRIKYKKRVYSFFHTHQRVGRFLAGTARYGTGASHALSRAGRNERRILFEANPGEMRFSPVWRQLLIPSIWTTRVRHIAKMAGIDSFGRLETRRAKPEAKAGQ